MSIKIQYFMNASELQTFANTAGNHVGTIVSITYDTGSGKYVLFYTSP